MMMGDPKMGELLRISIAAGKPSVSTKPKSRFSLSWFTDLL